MFDAKVGRIANKGGTQEKPDEQNQRKVEALRFGVEKLREMKRKMDEDRIREQVLVQERLKNDIVRQKKPPNMD